MLTQRQVLLTDTTMRDAHQSLFATRMRSEDMRRIAPYYARLLPQMMSMECWGGATFDVAMRFLREDPWQRLRELRQAMPNILTQMLLRASNAVGYTNYPDNVVKYFVQQAAENGIDLFRVFDALNSVDNMRVAIDAVRDTGALCEAAICYTGDLLDPSRPKYKLDYYLRLAREMEAAGAHIIGIKDMAGLCKPEAARELVTALKDTVNLPVHFHTHDTSGISAASVLAAVEAGVDAIDGAMDAMSGLTSQPNLGAIAAALRGGPRDPGVDTEAMRAISQYWEGARRYYAAFEPDIRAGTADVYRHEMPGGQYTNLREQARGLGLESRWPEVAQAYADVNQLFGDIVKVTPTSKVVGDMALFLMANNLSTTDVLDPEREIAFPESVISLMRGELGFPEDGFPEAIQKKVLGDEKPLTERPGAVLPPTDLEAERGALIERFGEEHISDTDLASHLMYPKVFADYAEQRTAYGDISVLPTSVFFEGMLENEEIAVDLEPGKTLLIRLLGRADSAEQGVVKLFFELNGQPRTVRIRAEGAGPVEDVPVAEAGNPAHVGAPMPGMVATVSVQVGTKVRKGDALLSIEAMKMETQIRAERDGTVDSVHVQPGQTVNARDLLIVYQD